MTSSRGGEGPGGRIVSLSRLGGVERDRLNVGCSLPHPPHGSSERVSAQPKALCGSRGTRSGVGG